MRLLSSSIVFLILLLFGCRSSKTLQTVITKKDTVVTLLIHPTESDSARVVHETFDRINSNTIDFHTFSSKIKVQYKDSRQRNYDFNAFVRIQKDSIIWISINASFGIEAFRVLITPDSVKILDKLDKNVQYRSVEYIRNIIQLPIDFYTLQNLIVGNPVYLDCTRVLMYKEKEQTISLSTMGDFFKQLLALRKDDYAILHSKLDDVDPIRNRTADFTYNDYLGVNGRLFSTSRKITIAEKTSLDISLDYKQIEFDIPLSFPFNIPRNYSTKEF